MTAAQSQEELDEAIERIKQKRRESAQRSRNRRASYMKQLEVRRRLLGWALGLLGRARLLCCMACASA